MGRGSATAYRDLEDAVRAGNLAVHLEPGIAWVFLKTPGFRLADFGDVRKRGELLGKWIATFPQDEITSEAKRLLPLIHAGKIKLAKVSNIHNREQPTGIIAVYCLDRDLEVLAALEKFAWTLRWKYNFETFAEKE